MKTQHSWLLAVGTVWTLLAPTAARGEVLDLPWDKTPDIQYTDFTVEYLSRGPAGQPEIKKREKTTPYVKNEIPAFLIEGEFYGDLAWLEASPVSIDYGLAIMMTSTGSLRRAGGTYGKVDVKSKSVLAMKPLLPNERDSSSVRISGKLECLFLPGGIGTRAQVLPLFFVEGTTATLIMKKGEQITLQGKPIAASEDAEIQFTFDKQGKPTMKVTKGSVKPPLAGKDETAANSMEQADNENKEIKPGDTVVVSIDVAPLGFGNSVIAELKKGTELIVTKVKDDWIGGYAVVNGEKKSGWVKKSQVRLRTEFPSEVPPMATTETTETQKDSGAIEKPAQTRSEPEVRNSAEKEIEIRGTITKVAMRTTSGPSANVFEPVTDLSPDPKSTVIVTLKGKLGQEFTIPTSRIVDVEGFGDLKGKHEIMGGLLILTDLKKRLEGKNVVLHCKKSESGKSKKDIYDISA